MGNEKRGNGWKQEMVHTEMGTQFFLIKGGEVTEPA